MYYSETEMKKTLLPWQLMLGIVYAMFMIYFIHSQSTAHAVTSITPTVVQTPTAQTLPVKPVVLPPAKPKFLSIVDTNEKVFYNKTDVFCMAKNIYHEAATESKLGKYAVAQVTINRTKDPRFEDGICEVVLEPYQFSWANNRRMQWTTPRGPNWEESKRIARDVIVEGKRVHGMNEALFYHADYVRPYWARAKRRLAQIGAHIFYEPRA